MPFPGHSYHINSFSYDNCVYLEKQSNEVHTYLLLYVDDMLIARRSMIIIHNLKRKLSDTFEMRDLCEVKIILGMDILRNKKAGKLFLSQAGYIERF